MFKTTTANASKINRTKYRIKCRHKMSKHLHKITLFDRLREKTDSLKHQIWNHSSARGSPVDYGS